MNDKTTNLKNPMSDKGLKLKDPMDNLKKEACPECGNHYFNNLVKLHSLSAEKSASNTKQFFTTPVYVCANGECGFILDPTDS